MIKRITILAGLLMLPATMAFAAPKSKLLEFWFAFDAQSQQVVDHSEWQSLLDKYLDASDASGINRIDYAAFEESDRIRLTEYLKKLELRDPRALNRAEQFAYWVNFYNALTVQTVLHALDKKPIESIKDIRFSWFSFGPWSKPLVEVQEQPLSLDNIEHGILRPIWNDRRIHYAVNCASLGCPNLQSRAFTASNTEALLNKAEHEFINHSRAIEVSDDRVKVSSLFKWYLVDFAADESGLLHYLSQHLQEGLTVEQLADKRIVYHYDWGLNQPSN